MSPLISLHAITGICTENTMQLCLSISMYELMALLDSGSTHNFISTAVVHCVGQHFHDSLGANVVVANGDHVTCHGMAQNIAINITDEHFAMDCYTIPLDYYDVVLGISFLHTLGPILWDFDDLCMAFWHHDRCILFKGIGSSCSDMPLTDRLHAIRAEEPALLDHLLASFKDVFEPWTRLPPSRSCDHRIHLLPNTAPMAVWPYRYH
ncbi:uncharacterized protein [Miscanthus floridulus]|uniref:uncharacterized protein n=1 Tax=Miscanthus floridulus TaxID=154761 RepID=UPI0034590139